MRRSSIGPQEQFSKLGNSLPDKEAINNAKSSLADMLERQPLVLGIVGMAIGAAVAGAFCASEIENQYIGEVSDDVEADLNRRAGAVSQALREASDRVVAEISDSGAEVVDLVKQAGMDATAAARAEVKSPQRDETGALAITSRPFFADQLRCFADAAEKGLALGSFKISAPLSSGEEIIHKRTTIA